MTRRRRRYEVESRGEEVERARRELMSLCEELEVELEENVLNVGILPGEQMAML